VPKVIPAFVISCAAIVTALGDIACSGSSHPAIVTPSIVTPSAIAIPTSLPLSVTEVSAGRGSTGGGTRLKIRGSNLTRGASVTFGNVKVSSNGYDPRDEPNTSLLITSPPHPAGVVDLVITTPDGILRLNEAFEFVDQEAFDFNGTISLQGRGGLVKIEDLVALRQAGKTVFVFTSSVDSDSRSSA